ncbi:MAG: hypothetical protein HYS32_04445 [Candidatus Woesearchaeota archaeon]|nr:MAG: hypothetical protein HYS32_04445 [Candidatus Woesearchaeota archaeon]
MKKPLKIKICPSCKSTNITFFIGYETGSYKCKNCHYIGPIILEKDITKKKLNK